MNSASAESRIGVAQTTDADGKPQGPQDSSARRGHGGYRADIEGLRGIAVVLVVLFHAGVWGMRGGFTGVDVFFVLSGYLITALLVREVGADGHHRLRPVLCPTDPAIPAGRSARVGFHHSGGVLRSFPRVEQGRYINPPRTSMYLSNVQFLRNASQYFAADMTADPFLHTWSLAVEEQFYLVWPALILVGFGAARSRRRLTRLSQRYAC